MTGAGNVVMLPVISGVGVLIFYVGGNGLAIGFSIGQAGTELRDIRFLAAGGPATLSRCPPCHKCLQCIHVYGLSGRNALQGHADVGPVGGSEYG